MKKAYIFYGGWDGHEPEKVSARFQKMLEKENFEVIREGSLERLDDEAFLKTMDLIIPLWTQGNLDDRYCFHLSDAIISGVGLAGCHGGMCDAFRWNIEYQSPTLAETGTITFQTCPRKIWPMFRSTIPLPTALLRATMW